MQTLVCFSCPHSSFSSLFVSFLLHLTSFVPMSRTLHIFSKSTTSSFYYVSQHRSCVFPSSTDSATGVSSSFLRVSLCPMSFLSFEGFGRRDKRIVSFGPLTAGNAAFTRVARVRVCRVLRARCRRPALDGAIFRGGKEITIGQQRACCHWTRMPALILCNGRRGSPATRHPA